MAPLNVWHKPASASEQAQVGGITGTPAKLNILSKTQSAPCHLTQSQYFIYGGYFVLRSVSLHPKMETGSFCNVWFCLLWQWKKSQ